MDTNNIVVDTTNLELLVTQQTEILHAIYISLLFIIGVVGAVFVCYLLYKFIKSFY